MKVINQEQAQILFDTLPPNFRVATLSPAYVAVDAKRDKTLAPYYLVYDEGNGKFVLHSLLKGTVPGTDYSDVMSPYGYGGPVTNAVDDSDFLEAAHEAYIEFAADAGILAEFTRLHPCVDHPFFGEIHYNRRTVYLPKEGSNYTAKCENMIRKAEKEGLEVIMSIPENIPHFAVSYRECMDRLRADKFYFFDDEYFEALAKLPNTLLMVVELDREWLSAAIFLRGESFWEYHLSCTNERGRKMAATNLLIDYTYALAMKQDKGLYLGGGKTALDNDPLLKFKSSFGGSLKQFLVGSQVFKPETYFALLEEYQEVSPVNSRTLFWR